MTNWRRYLKRPQAYDKPAKIDIREFFCEHDKLVIDITFPSDKSKLELVQKQEWTEIKRMLVLYKAF